MSFQKNEQSDFDFSVIDKKSIQSAKLNFSVESLLQQHQHYLQKEQYSQDESDRSSCRRQLRKKQSQQEQVELVKADGSFLQDLQKLQQELSFQSQLYNVYQQEASTINSQNPLIRSSEINAKSNSLLKITKQSNTLSIDDYGYLVIDFGDNKRKKTLRLQQISKVKMQKMHTHEGTILSSHRLKLSSEEVSRVIGEESSYSRNKNNSKTKRKSMQIITLGKLLSPNKTVKENSVSKEKILLKRIKSNNKQDIKQVNTKMKMKMKIKKQPQSHSTTIRQQKSPILTKTLSKSKSQSKTLKQKSSKKITTSTTTIESINNSKKSYTKSTNREGNVYSEYYGVEDAGDSQRMVMKSNCVYSSGSEKFVKSPNNKNGLIKKLSSKEKGKKMFRSPSPSPSSNGLTMMFKKKKTGQVS